MRSALIFEQPLNERIRTFLRIEQLMLRLDFCLDKSTEFDTHSALMTVLEILNLASRGDLKSELMKELKRQITNLEYLEHIPSVDREQLRNIMTRNNDLIDQLHNMSGQPGLHLKSNDFLNSLRQRTAIPGGTCDFDLPAYHFWLFSPTEERHELIRTWMQPFKSIQEAVGVVLRLIRESTALEPRLAKNGFYQENLAVGQPNQMIRIRMPNNSPVYPEISAGKHRFSIRFLEQKDLALRALQTDNDVDFELARSSL